MMNEGRNFCVSVTCKNVAEIWRIVLCKKLRTKRLKTNQNQNYCKMLKRVKSMPACPSHCLSSEWFEEGGEGGGRDRLLIGAGVSIGSFSGVYIHLHVCDHTYTHTHIHTCLDVLMRTRDHKLARTHVCVRMHMHVCVRDYKYVYHVCMISFDFLNLVIVNHAFVQIITIPLCH